MTRMRTTAAALALAATGLAIGGCAGGDSTATPVPAAPVTAPAESPSAAAEQSAAAVPAGWITGRITKGGEGPCYQMKADDGTAYAMHSADPRALKPGDTVKVKLAPSLLRMSCGDGTQVQIKALEPAT